MTPLTQTNATWKKVLLAFTLAYSCLFLVLLIINFKEDNAARAVILMSFFLFLTWVIIGGKIQLEYLKRSYDRLTSPRKHPLWSFVVFAISLSLTEEALATIMTNLAPVFGAATGQAFITASTNYFHVIFFHSVIVFIPMIFVMGFILKRYEISPFGAFLIFGIVGICAEFSLAGSAVFINAPFWICVYGLMVYLPAHFFTRLKRKEVSLLLYPIFIICITLSAASTFWIPLLLDKNHTKHFTE